MILINSQGIRPIPEFVEGVKQIKPPRNMREVKSLIGRLVWLKSFVGLRLNDHVKFKTGNLIISTVISNRF